MRQRHLSSLAEWKRRLSRAGAWSKDVLVCLDRTRALGLAAETAFWLFLSLVPLAAVAGLLAARFSTNNWSEVAPLLSSLPAATRQLVSAELINLATRNEGSVGAGSVAVFTWLASTGVHAMFDALEIGTGIARPWWKKRLLAIGMCIILPVVVVLLASLGSELLGAMGWLGRWIPPLRATGAPTLASRTLSFCISAGIVLAYVCALYRVGIPPRARRGVPILPGALLAVALEILFGFAYAFYIAKAGDGGAYLAGLAVIGVTMIGLYLFTAALLVGAVVNRKLAHGVETCPGAAAESTVDD
ncbi:Inner membrane protein YihY, formerly thought to be RNase BN [Minicystis rosea]|nr:Inner membrane protein YihY, formerly thought to be RNase BN [Minicystis rosea]